MPAIRHAETEADLDAARRLFRAYVEGRVQVGLSFGVADGRHEREQVRKADCRSGRNASGKRT